VATVEDVRTIALSLPDTDEHASYGGRPSFRVHKKGFCNLRNDETSISLYVSDLDEKEALLASDTKKFFTTPHYDGYRMICVRIAKVGVKELRELITDAWRLRAPKRAIAEFDAASR